MLWYHLGKKEEEHTHVLFFHTVIYTEGNKVGGEQRREEDLHYIHL